MRFQKAKSALTLAVISMVVLTVSACGGMEDDLTGASCSDVPNGLAPSGTGSGAFTMILRVISEEQVKQFASDPLRSRILDRDIFVINTQYKKMNTGEAEDIFASLRSEFPCNRVAALNGLGKVPGKPGYMFTLAGESELAAIILDWESETWAGARGQDWSNKASVNLKLFGEEAEVVANQIGEGGSGPAKTRVGLATQYRSGWNYAEFAKALAQVNWRLNEDFLGYQLVQTQDKCGGGGGSSSLAEVARSIRSQYEGIVDGEPGPKGWQKSSEPQREILDHLGFEISFSTKPKAGSSLPVGTDSSGDAAACTEQVLDVGGSAIIYWATPAAIEEMLATDLGEKFRPSS
jgi:hypothetical protein